MAVLLDAVMRSCLAEPEPAKGILQSPPHLVLQATVEGVSTSCIFSGTNEENNFFFKKKRRRRKKNEFPNAALGSENSL